MSVDPLASLSDQVAAPPLAVLAGLGTVFAEFGAKTQDSGNVSYGLDCAGRRYFVKTAGLPDDPLPLLKHPERVAKLRNAIALRQDCPHPALQVLYRVIESAHGPMLFMEWCDGELIYPHFDRFRELPPARILAALDTIVAVHRDLGRHGWVGEDFYGGCLIYDFGKHRLRLIDLDHYHRGPCINPGIRFGSSRFMAPEESQPGAVIDQRSTVFTLGRTIALLLSDGTLQRAPFRGDDSVFAVMTRACQNVPDQRFPDIAAMVAAWDAARAGG